MDLLWGLGQVLALLWAYFHFCKIRGLAVGDLSCFPALTFQSSMIFKDTYCGDHRWEKGADSRRNTNDSKISIITDTDYRSRKKFTTAAKCGCHSWAGIVSQLLDPFILIALCAHCTSSWPFVCGSHWRQIKGSDFWPLRWEPPPPNEGSCSFSLVCRQAGRLRVWTTPKVTRLGNGRAKREAQTVWLPT